MEFKSRLVYCEPILLPLLATLPSYLADTWLNTLTTIAHSHNTTSTTASSWSSTGLLFPKTKNLCKTWMHFITNEKVKREHEEKELQAICITFNLRCNTIQTVINIRHSSLDSTLKYFCRCFVFCILYFRCQIWHPFLWTVNKLSIDTENILNVFHEE